MFVKKSRALRKGKLRAGCRRVRTPSGMRYSCAKGKATTKRRRKKRRR